MDERKRSGLLWLACGATFLAILDVTVVNLTIPDLLTDFRSAQVTDVTWVITLYATVFAALLAPAGRLADVVGRRTLFVTGVGLFAITSLFCSLAPNLATLLVARAFQGAAAAVMIPTSLAIVLVDTPAARRAAAVGMWSASAALAATLGPAAGGILVDGFGWRSVFVVNVPVALILLAATWTVAAGRLDRAGRPGRLPDLVGAVLLAASVGLAVLGITQGREWHWTGARTLACFFGAVAALLWVLWRSRRHPVPAVEIGLWRSRTFAWANIVTFLFGASLFTWMLASVLFLTEVWQYSELEAGLAMSPVSVAATVAAIMTGRLIVRVGTRVVVVAGGLLGVIGTVLFAVAIPSEPHFLAFFLPIGLIGAFGNGIITTGLSTAAALSVRPESFAAATGLNQTSRQVGGALGIALLAAILAGYTGSRLDAYRWGFVISAIASAGTVIAGVMVVTRSTPKAKAPEPAADVR